MIFRARTLISKGNGKGVSKMKKTTRILGLLLILVVLGTGCSTTKDVTTIENLSWDQIVEAGSNSTVTFYGWGGSQETNDWVDDILGPTVKDLYNITLNRVPMDIDEMINKLIADKQGNNGNGTKDMIWINGENFFMAKRCTLLAYYRPIA